jgi:hypothetical protein
MNEKIEYIKTPWIKIWIIGNLSLPLFILILAVLMPLMSFTLAIVLGILFRGATTYVLISIPLLIFYSILSYTLKKCNVVNPKVVAFAFGSLLLGVPTIIYNLLEKAKSLSLNSLVNCLIVAFILSQSLSLIVALNEKTWKIYLPNSFLYASAITILLASLYSIIYI